ncbi:MAG: PAS domain S-box protein [Cyanobacteriota bacterium]|nr:PAS domain S-box protein [Cyanobacteriota bacterium]
MPETVQLLAKVALRIRQSLNLDDILNETVAQVRQFLEVDRVLIYRFHPDWSGRVAVESVAESVHSILDRTVTDPCFEEAWRDPYRRGRTRAIEDIHIAPLSQCHQEFLAQFQVRANLVVPILLSLPVESAPEPLTPQREQLWGLLIAHECDRPRQWQIDEIEFLEQLATHVAIAIHQAQLLARTQIELEERKQAEAALQQLNRELEGRVEQRTVALRDSERRFRSLFESAADFIYVLDTRGNIEQANSAAIEKSGYAESELLGRCLEEFLTPQSRQLSQQKLTTLMEAGVLRQELDFICKDGRQLTVDSSSSLVRDRSGAPNYILVVQRDISDRKAAQAVLHESNRRWQTLLDNVQLIVVGLHKDGTVEYVNPFFLKLTGYSESEILGRDWFTTVLPQYQRVAVYQIFREILEYNLHPHHQNPILTKSGEERIVAWNNTRLQGEKGTPSGTLSIGEDVTERYAISRMKDEFIAVVSHELRTPLTAIHGGLNLLSTGLVPASSDRGKHIIQIAAQSTERLVRLVNDILELERLESGKIQLVKESVAASELLEQASEQMLVIANRAGVTIDRSSIDRECWVDRDRLIQVLINLLGNAIEFSPAGSTVWLKASAPDDRILFEVRDRGRGIPPNKLETIFERFHQVDASDSRKKGGTGLGLAICRSIVEQHGGQIWAESTLGRGSCFYFTLPRLE